MVISWQLWALGAALFAAVTAVLSKLGLQGIDPNLATLLRTLVVAVVLSALLLFSGQLQALQLQALPRRSLLALALAGLATGLSWLCYFQALRQGPVAAVASIDKLSVLLVAVLAALWLGEQLSPAGWIGVLLMGAGAALVAWP
ncbi:transporter [Cyanobium sp.]|nr:transporter [Cyanobium sp.]